MTAPGLSAPLRRPVFRRLGASYAINEIGDWMGIVALSVLVYDRTESALATTVLFLGMSFVPGLLAPLLVAKAEQPPPRFVLPVLYCGEAAAFGTLAVLAGHFSLPLVFLVAAADGALALAARALTRAVATALLAAGGELRAGNALLNVAFTGGAALGPAIAGLVVAGLGVQSALLLDAVSFYVVAWILFTAGELPQVEPEPGRMRKRVKAGIAYIRGQRTLRLLLVAQGAAFVFFAAVLPVEVVYAKQTLGAGDSGYGLMLGSWGAGMVLGSLLFAAARKTSLAYLLFFSTIAVGIAYVGMALAPTLAVACAASVFGGAGNGVQWVTAISAVQELTAETMQARVMSVLESIGAAMPGVGFVLGGLIAALVSPRMTFLVAGSGVIAIVIAMAPLLRGNWPVREGPSGGLALDAHDDLVVELIPRGNPGNP